MTDIAWGTTVIVVVPALMLLGFAILARHLSRRMPRSAGPRFAPLAEGTVARDALLLNRDGRAMAAVLIDLAVRRRIRLLRPAEHDAKRAAISVEMVEGGQIATGELAVIEALFGPESSSTRVRRLSADSRRLSRRVSVVLESEERAGVSAGVFHAQRRMWPSVLLRLVACLWALVSLFFVIGAIGQDTGADGAGVAAAVAGFGIVVAVLIITPRPWRRFTAQAEPLRVHLAGMREYIDLAEKEPLRAVQSVQGALQRADVSAQARTADLQRFHLYERLLPYAVLFGMETSWLKTLGEHAGHLRENMDVGDTLEATFEVLAVIEAVGSVLALVRAVGELTDGIGSAAEAVGNVFDALS
ncbi:DUF2207 domain-containing protein [Microbacterium sp.]|uniref:DUF2207 family protein n=1 Tax=Microbacterium sp. TaxID=51671 RepID=UPI00262572E2|nr:DUF2207 domain-containing protein [Microbacterium sp.]